VRQEEDAMDRSQRKLVYTVSEAADELGISRSNAYELVARGVLAHVRPGRRVVVPKRAVLELLESPPATPAA
jgi:excisionase family DNA binding protein